MSRKITHNEKKGQLKRREEKKRKANCYNLTDMNVHMMLNVRSANAQCFGTVQMYTKI